MMGHAALFTAALVTSAAAALGLPPTTASEGCTTRLTLSQPTARMSGGLPQGVSPVLMPAERCIAPPALIPAVPTQRVSLTPSARRRVAFPPKYDSYSLSRAVPAQLRLDGGWSRWRISAEPASEEGLRTAGDGTSGGKRHRQDVDVAPSERAQPRRLERPKRES